METAALPSTEALRNCTAQIVAGFTRRNHVMPDQMPELITTVYKTLSGLGGSVVAAPVNLTPAVPIRKSITPEYLICLEDGKKMKMLKRHLRSTFGLTPDEYRLKWGLPSDYPMTARNYAQTRSDLAKLTGLGRPGLGRRDGAAVTANENVAESTPAASVESTAAEPAAAEPTAVATAPRKRAPRKAAGRSKKAAATRKAAGRSKKAAATRKSTKPRSRSRSKPTEAPAA